MNNSLNDNVYECDTNIREQYSALHSIVSKDTDNYAWQHKKVAEIANDSSPLIKYITA